jgi:hypothetical protein
MSQPVLITGTGRCRTAWAAKWLQSTGMQISHQRIKHDTDPFDWHPQDLPHDFPLSDVSFEAAPHAETYKNMGYRVVLLIRDPAAVVRSWLSLGAFADTMHLTHEAWWGAISKWAPEVCRAHDPIERATRFYVRWNQLALLADPILLTTEYVTTLDLADAVGVTSNRDMKDPGRVDCGTPGRIPVELFAVQKAEIRQRAWDYLPEPFHYHREIDHSPLHATGHRDDA